MYYILNESGQIIGTADEAVDLDDLKSRKCQVIESELDLFPEELEVAGFPQKTKITKKRAGRVPTISLKTTARDKDKDGVPELVADGKSRASITVTVKGAGGKLYRKPVGLYISTSAGRLSARRLTTKNGKARFTLTAGFDTVLATVNVDADGFESDFLQFEFMPPEDA
jgi:hypothetical protein